MTVLDRLAELHDTFVHQACRPPVRLTLRGEDRAQLVSLAPADWPFRHLADAAAQGGSEAALAELFGLRLVVDGDLTQFE
jgi:hypothetical protein